MQKKQLMMNAAAIILVWMMVGLSEYTGEKELIFPEITALTIGAWIAPKQSWNTSRWHIFTLITINAFLGVIFVRYLPLPMYATAAIALLICYSEMILTKTTFAPLISALILPIFLQTTSFIYPISAMVMAGIVALVQYIFIKTGLHEPESYTPVQPNLQKDWVLWMVRYVVMMVLLILPVMTKEIFFVAPPLIVAFTEISSPSSKARKKPFSFAAILILGASGGAACRYLLTSVFGLPLTISALAIVVILLVAMQLTKMYVPPVGALAILAMLIGNDQVVNYGIKAAAGTAIIVFAGVMSAKAVEIAQAKLAHERVNEKNTATNHIHI